MKEIEVLVTNKTGLHARPAKVFTEIANKYASTITVRKQGTETGISAKSIIRVLTLGACKGTQLVINVDGEDEEAAVAEITDFFAKNCFEE